jgi:hypothetical protein
LKQAVLAGLPSRYIIQFLQRLETMADNYVSRHRISSTWSQQRPISTLIQLKANPMKSPRVLLCRKFPIDTVSNPCAVDGSEVKSEKPLFLGSWPLHIMNHDEPQPWTN